MDRVKGIFFAVTEANKTATIEETEKAVVPLLTEFENEISFNQKFFERVKYVYDHERNSLKGEDKVLLEEIYKNFVRSGALLSKDKMARMKEINSRLAQLQQDFGNMLPKASAASTVWVDDVKELAGLSENAIAQCKKDAESRGGKAPYLHRYHQYNPATYSCKSRKSSTSRACLQCFNSPYRWYRRV